MPPRRIFPKEFYPQPTTTIVGRSCLRISFLLLSPFDLVVVGVNPVVYQMKSNGYNFIPHTLMLLQMSQWSVHNGMITLWLSLPLPWSQLPRTFPLLLSPQLETLEAVPKLQNHTETNLTKIPGGMSSWSCEVRTGLDWMDEGEWALVDSACSDWLSHSVVRLPLNGLLLDLLNCIQGTQILQLMLGMTISTI